MEKVSRKSKVIGVMGGMGPEATIDFMRTVIRLTPAEQDQDHIRMLVDHDPSVPNRQQAIFDDDKRVGTHLAEMAVSLEQNGADFLVMPCNSAHAFESEILASVGIPFISIVEETTRRACELIAGGSRVGVLAAAGCYHAGIYQASLTAADKLVLTPPGDRIDALMEVIYRIKAGDVTENTRREIRDFALQLIVDGAEIIIAACTEIPLVLSSYDIEVPLVSSTEVLAERAVALAIGTDRNLNAPVTTCHCT